MTLTPEEMLAKLDRIENYIVEQHEKTERFVLAVDVLAKKAKVIVDLLDDVERNQGGLLSVQALRGRDELRLELSKWK